MRIGRILVVVALGFLAGIVGCERGVAVKAAAPAAATRPAAPYVKRLAGTADYRFKTLGLATDFEFEYLAPEKTETIVWVETYERGKLNEDLTWGTATSGEKREGRFFFLRYDPDVVSETKSVRARWQINFPNGQSFEWVDDPFKKGEAKARKKGGDVPFGTGWESGEKQWEVEPGRDYVVLRLVGTDDASSGALNPDAPVPVKAVVVQVKVRFEPVNPKAGSELRSFSGLPAHLKK